MHLQTLESPLSRGSSGCWWPPVSDPGSLWAGILLGDWFPRSKWPFSVLEYKGILYPLLLRYACLLAMAIYNGKSAPATKERSQQLRWEWGWMFSKQNLTIKTLLTTPSPINQNPPIPFSLQLWGRVCSSMLKTTASLGRAGHLVRERAQTSGGPPSFKLLAFPDLPGPGKHKPLVSCRWCWVGKREHPSDFVTPWHPGLLTVAAPPQI